MKAKVQVLMSIFHGEKYIRDQLDSLLNQKEIDLKLLIRIDGYDDPTKNIIEEYMKKYKSIELYDGQNLGYAKSFWDLILHADLECDYYAFCDQDDIWNDDKLYSAIKMMESDNNSNNNIAKLYTSKVNSFDTNMNLINSNTFNTTKALDVYESLQKSKFPGCVFVFNKKSLEYLKRYDGFMESHDWIAYAIISILGKTFYDSESHIKYRIHDNNTIGKKSFFKDVTLKFKRFFSKPKRVRSKMAQDIYRVYENQISKEIVQDIYQLGFYRNKISTKIKLLLNSNYKGFIFKILVLLNKV